MATGQEPNSAGFLPGDRVRVADGTFIGKVGRVVSYAEATALWEANGGQAPPLYRAYPGMVCAVLDLFGRSVPVWFQTFQLGPAEDRDETRSG
jgi:transcription antitermination factor NusG